jgi:hypothetical protein
MSKLILKDNFSVSCFKLGDCREDGSLEALLFSLVEVVDVLLSYEMDGVSNGVNITFLCVVHLYSFKKVVAGRLLHIGTM